MAAYQHYYQTPGHNIAAGAVLATISLLAISGRFWTRIKFRQGLKADDWLILIAAILTIASGILIVYGVAKGALATRVVIPAGLVGNNLYTLKTEQIILMAKIQIAFAIMQPLILGSIKLSFLFFYKRLFVSRVATTKIGEILVFIMVLVCLWMVAFFFALVFFCKTNFWAIWSSTQDLVENCADIELLLVYLSASDFITDIFIIFIPIPLIWRLKLSTGKKIGACAIFCLGIVSIAASMTRMITTIQMYQIGFDPEADEIFIITMWLYWGMVESGLGVLAACLPTFSILTKLPIFQSIWKRITGGTTAHSGSTANSLDKSRFSSRSKTRSVHQNDRRAYHVHPEVHKAGSTCSGCHD